MAVFTVHSQPVKYLYKTHLCTKATLIFILTSFLTVMFPVIFTYRSHGFWLRTDTYQEQPDVSFKYDYILLLGTTNTEHVFFCSNLPHLITLSEIINCSLIKAREEDLNRDGYKESLHFGAQVSLPQDVMVYGVTLLLFFDYKLSSHCRMQMEAMALVQESSPLAGAGVHVTADLALEQRRPLYIRHHHSQYNESVIPPSAAFSLHRVLEQYALRNISARLTNVYSTWTTHPVPGEPFTIDVTVVYKEATVRYIPSFWQILRHSWVQFFPVLVIFIFLFRAVKNFIYGERLVTTYMQEPWTKF